MTILIVQMTQISNMKVIGLMVDFLKIVKLEMYDIPVVSLTSDEAKPNRRFYSMCQQQQQKGQPKDVPYKTFNPFREGQDLFFFCDAPHLLSLSLSLSLLLFPLCFNALDVSHCRRMGRRLVGSGLISHLCFEGPCKRRRRKGDVESNVTERAALLKQQSKKNTD